MGSGITYAKRYSLQAAMGLPSEDDDGNAAADKAVSVEGAEDARRQETERKGGRLVMAYEHKENKGSVFPVDDRSGTMILSGKLNIQ